LRSLSLRPFVLHWLPHFIGQSLLGQAANPETTTLLLILGVAATVEAQEQSLFQKQNFLFLTYRRALEGCQAVPGKISDSDVDCAERASKALNEALDQLRKSIGPTALEQLFLDGYSNLGQVYAVNFMGCGMPGSILLEGRRVFFLCDPAEPANLYSPANMRAKSPMLLL